MTKKDSTNKNPMSTEDFDDAMYTILSASEESFWRERGLTEMKAFDCASAVKNYAGQIFSAGKVVYGIVYGAEITKKAGACRRCGAVDRVRGFYKNTGDLNDPGFDIYGLECRECQYSISTNNESQLLEMWGQVSAREGSVLKGEK